MYNSSETFDQYFNQELYYDTISSSSTNTSNSNTTNTSNLLVEFWKSPLTRAIVKMYKKPLIYSGHYPYYYYFHHHHHHHHTIQGY
jgi:hypothetical protein